jgi:hypothetical protein
MTKTASDNDQVPQQPSSAGGTRRGQRKKRAKGELVPILERLRPRQVKNIKATGRALAKPPSSRQKLSQQEMTSVSSSLRGIVSALEQGDKKEAEDGVHSLNWEGSKEEEKGTTEEENVVSRKDGVMDVTNETVGEKDTGCTEWESVDRGEVESAELLLPHIPKLRRMHAMTLPSRTEMDVEHKNSQTYLPHPSNDCKDCSTLSVSSTGTTPSLGEHVCTCTPASESAPIPTSGIVTKRIQRKRGRPRRTAIAPTTSSPPTSSSDSLTTPALLSPCSIVVTASTSEMKNSSNNLYSKECGKLSAPVTTLETVSMTHSNNELVSSIDGITGSEETILEADESLDLSEYPQPSTYFQKMQRQLARQKQLQDMRAREAAEAREERFLRRQGLSKSPEKKIQQKRHLTWKEEDDLVEVFVYSPCSSRGSTLEPELLDDVPDFW